jgi:hypothetical protein
MNPVIQHRDEQLGNPRPYPAVPLGQYVGAQQEHRPHLRHWQWLADAAGVAAHQVSLQRYQFIHSDPHFGQLAKSGVDTVDGFAATNDRVHNPSRCLHPGTRPAGDGDAPAFVGHAANLFQRQRLAIQLVLNQLQLGRFHAVTHSDPS